MTLTSLQQKCIWGSPARIKVAVQTNYGDAHALAIYIYIFKLRMHNC